MLLNELYTLKAFDYNTNEGRITALVLLNSDHPVFEGHFPGNPILPGVCTVQIVRELLASGKKLMLTRAGNIKYLGFVNPVATPEVQFTLSLKTLDNGGISCGVEVMAGGHAVCNFKGEYRYLLI
jgi:3-hydroxyacyl-[acyl-carrier-protein] dehydratase